MGFCLGSNCPDAAGEVDSPTMKVQTVKGTADLLPEQQAAWSQVLDAVTGVLGRAGSGRIDTPIFEYAELFERSVGDSADIVVQKEMYTFDDRGGRRLALRPEFTASVMRSFIEHGMHTRPSPVKLWSAGPLFRAENVQRGRYRQFHQVNCEIIGSATPLADAESIWLMSACFRAAGIERFEMKIGSVGDPADRAAYNDYLRTALAPDADKLTPVSQERLRLNPMRLLDAKDAGDQRLLAALDRPLERLGEESRAHFEAVKAYLDDWGMPYVIDPGIVRGLDYYRRTAFEAHYPGIGAQSALGGGGRYDGLIANLGGPDLPGVGWAFGIERVLAAIEAEGALRQGEQDRPALFIVPLDDSAVTEGAAAASRLRASLRVEFAYQRRNPGKGLKDADRSGARFAALRGEQERERGVWLLKNLASGEQSEVSDADFTVDGLAHLLT